MRSSRPEPGVETRQQVQRGGGEMAWSGMDHVRPREHRGVRFTRGVISAVFIGAAIPIAILLLSRDAVTLRERGEAMLAMASVMTAKHSEATAVSLADNATVAGESDGGNQTSAVEAGAVETKDGGEKGEPRNGADASSAEKVVVRLYMESECPACKAYSTHYIKSLLETPKVKDFVDFKFVPWGNGVIKNKKGETINTTTTLTAAVAEAEDDAASLRNLTFYCQHGGSECAGNAVEACIQAKYPQQADFFPVIHCIEKRACAEDQKPPACSGSPAQVTSKCLDDYGPHMDKALIEECAKSTAANKLLLQNALETAQLKPAKSWVPWVTIDGKNLGGPDPKTFTEMFLIGQIVCGAWANKTGQDPPAECAHFPTTIPKDPYPDEDAEQGSGSEGVNWWIVGLSLVAFIGAIAAMYFLLYNATKVDSDGLEPLHKESSDWGGVDRD